MIAVLLTSLFIAAGTLAIVVIAREGRRHGPAFAKLRAELQECAEWREVHVRITSLDVQAPARVMRPAFKATQRRPEAGLRAAA